MPRHRRGWGVEGGLDCHRRHTPLTVSMLEPALLILIKEQPRHGYTLMGELDALGMATFHPSVVYKTLREMEELEWIESNWDMSQTQGPPRKTYQLTRLGEEVLKNWAIELGKAQETIAKLLSRSRQ
jgi:PadR family transcriptional regulator, regulatory protein PadR